MGDRRVIVVLVFFALFVLIISLLGIVFNRNITGYQISSPGWGVSNTMTIKNDDSSSFTNHPLQFGRAFILGEIAAGNKPQVLLDGVAVTTQVDSKNYYDDGSLKFAVISIVVPSINSGQTKTISFQTISDAQYSSTVGSTPLTSTDMLNNFNFDPIIELVNPAQTHSLSARTMIQNGDIETYWTSGPISTTVVLADHSAAAQYDVGWEQQNTKLTKCVSFTNTGCSISTILEVADASWLVSLPAGGIGQILNLQDELVQVTAVNTVGQDTITVIRDFGGIPHLNTVDQDYYVTSATWQPTTQASRKSFRPIFIADFWPAPVNKVRVRYIGENTNTEAMQDVFYDLNLKNGASNLFSNPSVTHHIGARWAKQFWLTTVSEKLSINHNKDYLAQTGVVDYYDSSVQPSPTVVSNWYNCYTSGTSCGALSLNNGGNGIFQRTINVYTAMGPGGGRWELGPIPTTNALWVNNMDWRMQNVALAMADMAGSWVVHFREGDANKVYNRDPLTGTVPSSVVSPGAVPAIGKWVSSNARPTLAIETPLWTGTLPGDKLNFVSRFTHGEANNPPWVDGSRQTWSTSLGHLYNFFPVPYAFTGDYYYYDSLQAWNAFSVVGIATDRGPTPGTQGGRGGGLTSSYGARYQCRPAYTRGFSAWYGLDGTPEKEHAQNMLYDAIITWMGAQNIPLSQEPSIPATSWNNVMWSFGRNEFANPPNPQGAPNLPSPLKFWTYGSTFTNAISDAPVVVGAATHTQAPWMTATCAESMGYAKALGYPVDSLLGVLSDYYLWHFNTPGFNPIMIGAYREPTADINGVALSTPAQVASAYNLAYQSNPCAQPGLPNFCGIGDGENYLSYHTSASSRLYQYDQTAYTWLRSSSGVVNAYASGIYNKDPRYALAPRPNSITCVANSVSSCSTGFQGICSAGQHTCNPLGNGYGACTAVISPNTQPETCDALNQDEDCDGQVNEGCDCTTFFGGQVCSAMQSCFGGSFIPQASPSSCCGSGGTCQTVVVPTGLVAAYTFSEGSGTTTTDASGNGNNGVLINGPIWSLGKYDNGLIFDGVNDYVEVPNSASLNPAQMTISAWLFDPIAGAGMVVGKGAAGDQYHLRVSNSNLRFRINGSPQIELPVTFTPGWHHVAGTYDTTNFKLYYDGVLIGTSPNTAAISTSTTPLRIGIRFDSSGNILNPFTGEIDEVRIYNRALTAAEVFADMNSPLVTGNVPSSPSGLSASLV
ncbi:MAG: LamG domain-containing protein [Candidatus Pacearchaeota archaeon]